MRYFFSMIFLLSSQYLLAQTITSGEQIFNNTCATCHTIGGGRVVGPDLMNITEKRSKEYIFQFIRNSQQLIEKGNEHAIEIFNEFNKIPMPPHDFSDTELEELYAYISATSEEVTINEAVDAGVDTAEVQPARELKKAETEAPGWFYIFTSLIFIITVVLVSIIIMLIKMVRNL